LTARPGGARPTLYNPDFEHDGCGTGFVASLRGERSHRIVELAADALVNLTHRGAVSADSVSGDGAGVTIQVPHDLLHDDAVRLGMTEAREGRLGVAMVFLPVPEEPRVRARLSIQEAASRSGIEVHGWRPVPTDASVLGGVARASMPAIEQALIAPAANLDTEGFRRALYLARRRAERALRAEGLDAYIVSMSCDTVVYKGLVGAAELRAFYPDLTDVRTTSALALFHQRFATNTAPDWKLAQPFRFVAHNGEINTLIGNRNWMTAREVELGRGVWGQDVADLVPVILPIGSDTASLDEALDLLVASGRDLLEAMAMLIPEAWESMPGMDRPLRAFYQYHACLSEPWDGPAAVAFTNGRVVAAALDRNGLRPARYKVTADGLVVLGSEVGILDLAPERVVESGRLGPGQMIAVDTATGCFLEDSAIKRALAQARPYERWLREGMAHLARGAHGAGAATRGEGRTLAALAPLHALHGYTDEEVGMVLRPMAEEGAEPVGSMGDDTPHSVLNGPGRTLYTYFRQRFAQVTNPPIDSIREKIVMSLDTWIGRRVSYLEPEPEAARLVHLSSPILLDEELAALGDGSVGSLTFATLPALFAAADGPEGMARGLDELCVSAAAAVEAGCDVVVLSDRGTDERRAPIPMLLATSAVHHHLIRSGCRMRASLIAEAGDARDVHHFASLIGFGASAVNPYVALETVAALGAGSDEAAPGQRSLVGTYVRAVEAGLLKIMSKMGISAVASYHGAQIFEALGLGEELIARYFPGTTSRIGGIGLEDIVGDVLARHARAHDTAAIEKGGWYRYRRDGDYHANEPPVWRALHAVAQGGGEAEYRAYANLVHGRPPTALRDLLELVPDRVSIPIEEVEPVEAIARRFQTGAMSLGALSAEAHEDVARAMNRLGALSNTGEGGEDPERYSPQGARREAASSVKQVASGRFGVTAGYLAGAAELEIKIAQGSKPGEGGQLPGEKVTGYIATLRHVYEGTALISPPPHHDIYSIEDIAQLIYDLEMVNPEARVCVKLVSAEGVGTIAAGVAKAFADVIHIAGADGGTGASPLSSVKYAGDPWELGLAETQQTLVRNGLRGRVRLATDGGLHTGRDVVTAALLGADRYGFGTTALIALGCKMARQCHSNTCPVGIATQAEELREKYFGTPEMLVRFLTHVAAEVREILAWLGYARLDDVIGRADLLRQIPVLESARWRGVDLTRVITPAEGWPLRATSERNDRADTTLDDRILCDLDGVIEAGGSFSGSYEVRNTDRTVGGRVAGRVARAHGDGGLAPGSIDLRFTGSAGQSFGAWLAEGMRLTLNGEANDYVAKGMSGGEVSVLPPAEWASRPKAPTLVGNTVLYGATGGSLFVAGRAGERFAVRNSGACAVVEGVGAHGCEYMTRGVVVVLGETGRNFAAGMSGGIAFVLDEQGDLPARLNPALVAHEQLAEAVEIELLRVMIQRHYERTASARARRLLAAWPRALPLFWRVAPKEAAGAQRAVRRRYSETQDSLITSSTSPGPT
jgi:glutamate synthase domain-containing protein 2/glutamate synthase domain-containing protein 1/glutamate synthase domain-containing protein 3